MIRSLPFNEKGEKINRIRKIQIEETGEILFIYLFFKVGFNIFPCSSPYHASIKSLGPRSESYINKTCLCFRQTPHIASL